MTVEENVRRHVRALAADIGERNVFRPEALRGAARYIEEQWLSQGYEVSRQTYDAKGVESSNLEISRSGSTRPDEIILIGAHYDSVAGSPGANDNGSGAAVMLELSQKFANTDTDRTVRFTAFTNEEPPFFNSSLRGSRVYAKMAKKRGDKIIGAIILECLGCYSHRPGSQGYPALIKMFYPDRGNFIAFVSNIRSRAWLRLVVTSFKSGSTFPAESLAAFTPLAPGAAWSDHSSFWEAGYRALMVTDTAFYRYPYYHSASDTIDKIDYVSMARVTEGLFEAVKSLAQLE